MSDEFDQASYAPLILMEDEEFRIPATELSNHNLRDQVAWHRSWLRSSGFSDLDAFYAEQEASNVSLLARMDDCRAESKVIWDAYNSLVSARKAIIHRLKDAREKWVILRLSKNNTIMSYTAFEHALDVCQKAVDDIKAELNDATRLCEKQLELLEPWQFSLEYLNQHHLVNVGVQAKITRMRALEAEFSSRNATAKAAADFHAWSLGREPTYVEPKIPEYVHSYMGLGDGGSDCMVIEHYSADINMASSFGGGATTTAAASGAPGTSGAGVGVGIGGGGQDMNTVMAAAWEL